jgi:hypothetical protein
VACSGLGGGLRWFVGWFKVGCGRSGGGGLQGLFIANKNENNNNK